MLVDGGGQFLTQRSDPRMALLHVELRPRDGGAGRHGPIRVHAPDGATLDVPLPAADAPRRRVQVWDDRVDGAATYPSDVDAWLTAALGRPCHLVYMPDDAWRQVDPAYAGPGDRTSFTDAFPLLLVSRESVADLNARLAERGAPPVDERRFRPNVVVEDAGRAFAEDDWRGVRVGGATLAVAKPCARCVVTTVDPDTARPSSRGEPLRTLATYRTRGGKVLFAQNALVRSAGRVRVGDAVHEA
jgi:hypothetical protein